MKQNKKLYILCSLFIILIISTSITKTLQNDTFFTIATGNHILENGYDNLDHLSWHKNLNFYKLRWGFDVIISLVYNTFSFTGIYVFVLVIACITGFTLFNMLIKQNCKILIAFFITVFSMISVVRVWGFTARAQIISYLLLLLEIFCVENLIEKRKNIYFLFLFFISVFIVNFHASVWFMTLILMAPYFLEALIAKFHKTNNNSRIVIQQIDIKTLLTASLVLILGSFFSPIGAYHYTYMFKVVGGVSSQFISELQAVNIFTQVPMITIIALFFILFSETKSQIRLTYLTTFIGLFLMSILAYRNLAFLYTIGAFVIGKYLTSFFEIYDKDNLLDKLSLYLQKKNVFILVVFIVFIFSMANYSKKINEPYIDESQYPISAVNYIKTYLDYDNLKVFNHFNFGSYMELNGIKAFIDSRSEIYCKEFNNTEVLQDWYETTVAQKQHYNKLFKKYNIDYAILYNIEMLNIYMAEDNNYIKIYCDDYFSIYMKKELYNKHYIGIPLIIK